MVHRAELPRPANAAVLSLTDRGAALECVVREFIKWSAPLMSSPAPTSPSVRTGGSCPRVSCAETMIRRRPGRSCGSAPASTGCVIAADAGMIRVMPSGPGDAPDAVVTGDPGALVALFAGPMHVETAPAAHHVSGNVDAERRIVGGLPPSVAGAMS